MDRFQTERKACSRHDKQTCLSSRSIISHIWGRERDVRLDRPSYLCNSSFHILAMRTEAGLRILLRDFVPSLQGARSYILLSLGRNSNAL